MAGCEFDIRTSLTVVQHEFNHSWSRGIRAIGEELANSFSRVREIQAPTGASFGLTYEINNDRLYWPGDRLSVEAHMRRNIVWLKANGGTEAQIKQARLDLLVFREIQHRALNLDDGQSVMWLAQKTTEPTDGVALQQIKRDGDKLIQSSQLLPFDQQNQIDNFIDSLNENREVVSVEDGVGGWIVQGEAINFEQELPEIIDGVMDIPVPIRETKPQIYPVMIPALPPSPELPINRLIGNDLNLEQAEVITVSEVAGFWFEVMAAAVEPIINEIQVSEFIGENTSGSELEVAEIIDPAAVFEPTRRLLVDSESRKPATVKHESRTEPLRIIPEGRPAKTAFVGKKSERSRSHIIVKTTEKKAEKKVIYKRHAAVSELSIKKTLDKKKDKSNTVARELSTKTSSRAPEVKVKKEVMSTTPTRTVPVGDKRTAVIFSAPEPPIYKMPESVVEPPVFNTDEILVWQPHLIAVVPDYTIYILAFFLALSNTNMVQLEPERGSGK